jgi:hypothetical protein
MGSQSPRWENFLPIYNIILMITLRCWAVSHFGFGEDQVSIDYHGYLIDFYWLSILFDLTFL